MTSIPSRLRGRRSDPDRVAQPDVWIAWAAGFLALLPIIVTVVVYSGRAYLPGGDIAIIDLRVRDVFTSALPLVGPYSRYGWNHPGPALFYALAPLNVLTGGAAWSTLVGGALLQGLAIVLTVRLAWQRAGAFGALLIATAISLTAVGATERLFLVPWNPHIALPFFALFVLQVWSVGLGHYRHVVGATIVGSFLVQSHVGYAPLVAGGAVWAAVVVLLDLRQDRSPLRNWFRSLAWGSAAAVVLWAPPIVQQFDGTPGNLGELLRFARRADGVGLDAGLGVFAGAFGFVPPWLGGTEPRQPFTDAIEPSSLGWLLIPILVLIVGWVVARRAGPRGRECGRLLTLVAVMGAIGALAIARVDPPLDSYLFLWRSSIATLIVAGVLMTLVGVRRVSIADRNGSIFAGSIGAILAAATISLGVNVANPAQDPNPFASDTRALLDQLAPAVPDEPFIVRNVASARRGVSSAIVDELLRDDAPVRVDEDESIVFGSQRAIPRRDARWIWLIAEEGRDVSLLTEAPGSNVIARTSPLSTRDEAELVRLQRTVARSLRELGRADLVALLEYSSLVHALDEVAGLDQRAIERIAVLTERAERRGRCRCAVIAFRPADAPSLDAAATDSR